MDNQDVDRVPRVNPACKPFRSNAQDDTFVLLFSVSLLLLVTTAGSSIRMAEYGWMVEESYSNCDVGFDILILDEFCSRSCEFPSVRVESGSAISIFGGIRFLRHVAGFCWDDHRAFAMLLLYVVTLLRYGNALNLL